MSIISYKKLYQKGTTELDKIMQDFTIHQSSEGVRVQEVFSLYLYDRFCVHIYTALQGDDLLDLMDNLS